jgi:hypothetical protein
MLTGHHAGTVNIVINGRKTRGDIPLLRIKPRCAETYFVPSDCSSPTRVVVLGRSRNLQCLIAHCNIHHVRISIYAISSV